MFACKLSSLFRLFFLAIMSIEFRICISKSRLPKQCHQPKLTLWVDQPHLGNTHSHDYWMNRNQDGQYNHRGHYIHCGTRHCNWSGCHYGFFIDLWGLCCPLVVDSLLFATLFGGFALMSRFLCVFVFLIVKYGCVPWNTQPVLNAKLLASIEFRICISKK